VLENEKKLRFISFAYAENPHKKNEVVFSFLLRCCFVGSTVTTGDDLEGLKECLGAK